MTDVYSGHSQFILLADNRRRWFDGRTVFLITVITIPVVIFCGIYTIILRTQENLLYPQSPIDASPMWVHRAKAYSHHPKTHIFSEIHSIAASSPQLDDYKLVCYYNFPGNGSGLLPQNIDPFLCTHLVVAFASIVNNSVYLSDSALISLDSVVALKKTNDKLKVMVSVGGAGDCNGFKEMVLNHTTRKQFIHSVLELVKNKRVDGVDLDWEFPNQDQAFDKHQKLHFTQLLEEMRNTINKQTRHKFLVSVAVAAPVFLVDSSYDVSYLNQFVDFVNVMSYDYHFYTKLTPFTGLNSPLFASYEDAGYFLTLNINYTAHYWLSKGMSRDKIVIGLPTYGHTFRLTNLNSRGVYAAARGYGKLGDSGFVDYTQVCKFLNLNQITPVFDVHARSPYAIKGAEWLSFDNEQSLSFKAEFVKDLQFGGVMIYSLNTDDYMGACKIDPNVPNQPFPLVKKVHEILNKNYSLF